MINIKGLKENHRIFLDNKFNRHMVIEILIANSHNHLGQVVIFKSLSDDAKPQFSVAFLEKLLIVGEISVI
jgi:hypothetical protein